MELLTRTFATFRRLLSPNGWITLGLLVFLLALEALGRLGATSDLHDALAVSILALLGAFAYYRHRATPFGWASRLARVGSSMYNWAWSWTFDLGIDMRGSPRVKRGYPPAILAIGALLLAWLTVLIVLGADLPQGIRAAGVKSFYLGYLVFVALIWTLLIAGILLAFFIPMAMIHDSFVHAHEGDERRPRQREMGAMFLFFFCLAVVGWLIPIWGLLLVCAAALILNVATTVLPANSDVQFLWRPRNSVQVRTMPWSHWISCEFTLITLVLFDLVLTACGPRALFGTAIARSPMPFTAMLGTLLAWLAPGLLGAMVWQSILGRWRDPARNCRPILHVHGEVLPNDCKVIEQTFQSRGWDVQYAPAAPDRCSVQVEIVAPEKSQAFDFDPTWPLAVSLTELTDMRLFDRLARRDEIQARRRSVNGLERLFKYVNRRRYNNGHGFWVAPHFWFIVGLTRDAQEEEIDLADSPMLSGTVGPAFHRVFPRAARHHMFRLMRALHVDLIFVEDGVKFRRFVKVLRRMFEIYDKHSGRKPAEDVHFVGLPGTRVMIHDFQLDEPFKSETYPEPKYDYLGRARILHVFRDRNEDEELIEPPADFSRRPTSLVR